MYYVHKNRELCFDDVVVAVLKCIFAARPEKDDDDEEESFSTDFRKIDITAAEGLVAYGWKSAKMHLTQPGCWLAFFLSHVLHFTTAESRFNAYSLK